MTLLLVAALLAGPAAFAGPQDKTEDAATPAAAEEQSPSDGGQAGAAGRAQLNLMGRTDSAAGESRRNENVQFNAIDNNALKELNQRLGATATIVTEFRADRRYFAAEYGNEPGSEPHLSSAASSALHGSAFWTHQNSLFSARSFFQAGNVKPARENDYGLTAGAPAWRGGFFSLDASRRRIRGNVNGNVLVPTAQERTPLTTDPALRRMVERFLGAYPSELPNRTDINERALNTNSLQRIDDDHLAGRLEQSRRDADRLMLTYSFTLERVQAFQLVAGQNPDTTTRAHQARLTWNRQWSARTLTNFTLGFGRVGSTLVPEKNAVGPLVLVEDALEMLGPSSSIPIDRAQNQFTYAGDSRQVRGRHTWYAGFRLTRRQLNGSETSSHRGVISFSSDFGRDAIANLRMGTATQLSGAIGHVHRGFRNWEAGFFAGDAWNAAANLTVNIGLRYEPVVRPYEVNRLDEIPYRSDLNNFAPSLGLAYRLPGKWGSIRNAYGLHYGEIYPVTYGQMRYNPPSNSKFEIQVPDLRRPLAELLATGLTPDVRNTLLAFSPDLVAPYSHQYNFSWEPALSNRWGLQLGYVGSRSPKLLYMWALNRARPVSGIEQITDTVQDRRPNPEVGEIRTVMNGSFGYYDAAKASLVLRRWRGASIEASYWFSKAIDLGTSYSNTAAGRDAFQNNSQGEFEVHRDRKGLSEFDQPHAFLLRGAYDLPSIPGAPRWQRRLLDAWSLGAVVLAKTGTPFSVRTGSDGPGYGNVDGTRGDRPNLVDPSVLGRTIGHPDTSRELLPATAFAFIEPTAPRGNLGSNTFRKGPIANVNASLARRFRVGGDDEILFRAESINFLNTPQFAEPGHNLSSPQFGYITNTLNDGRTFRFMLQLSF
ncbi:MAG: hypothetical protein KIT09_23515 [Bryobacteraceae bacterium]|nr:hypothetical protein [Bryobacteraceae bacterium]